MKHKNTIVRTKTIHINESGHYYENNLVTWEKFISRSKYVYYNVGYKLYPYKWYDFRYVYQVPAYWILLKLRRNENEISNKQYRGMSIVTLFIEMLSVLKPLMKIFE